MFVYHGYESLIGPRVYKAVHCFLSVSRAMASCGCFQLPWFVTSKGMTDPNGKWVCLILISAKKKKKSHCVLYNPEIFLYRGLTVPNFECYSAFTLCMIGDINSLGLSASVRSLVGT